MRVQKLLFIAGSDSSSTFMGFELVGITASIGRVFGLLATRSCGQQFTFDQEQACGSPGHGVRLYRIIVSNDSPSLPYISEAVGFRICITTQFLSEIDSDYGKITENARFEVSKSLISNEKAIYVMGLLIPCFTFFSLRLSVVHLFQNSYWRDHGANI